MSLRALIYHNMKGISNPDDLKQIVHIGNQLYSSLSKLKQDNHSYIDVDKLSHRKLNELPKSRISLKTLILRNNGKTEFLMCISSYCAACIYQQNTTVRLFSLLT